MDQHRNQKRNARLKQAGKIAHDWFKTHLAKFYYLPCHHTPPLWIHNTPPIRFTLIVDDFGIKYSRKKHAQHQINSLQKKYVIAVDWTEKNFLGLEIDWNYRDQHITISMTNYIYQTLRNFNTYSTQNQKTDK